MTDTPQSLGDIIRTRRLELGLNQQELANAVGLGMTQRDVSYLERGQVKVPRTARIERLADVLGVDRGLLFRASGFADFDRYGHAPDPDLIAMYQSLTGDRLELMLTANDLSPDGVASVLAHARWRLEEERERGVLPPLRKPADSKPLIQPGITASGTA